MPISMRELHESRAVHYGQNGGGELRLFILWGSTDQVEIFDHLVANTEPIWDGFYRSEIRPKPLGGGVWSGEVEYDIGGLAGGETPVGVTPVSPTAPGGNGAPAGGNGDEPLGPGYAIDISAETVNVKSALKTFGLGPGAAEVSGIQLAVSPTDANVVTPTADSVLVIEPGDAGRILWVSGGTGWAKGGYTIVEATAAGNTWTLDRSPAAAGTTNGFWRIMPTAPDLKNAINVTKDEVGGVDIFGPKFEWSRSVSRETVTRNYIRTLRNLVGKKNDAPFYGSEPAEVLYLGASGSNADGNKWGLTHKFAEVANKSNIVIIPGELTIPFKRGWDYVWFTYKSDKPADGKRIVKVPDAAYVAEVVEDGDFSGIDIGY